MAGSLDGMNAKVISTADYPLIITISRDGVAEVYGTGIEKATAAELLTRLAETFTERNPPEQPPAAES